MCGPNTCQNQGTCRALNTCPGDNICNNICDCDLTSFSGPTCDDGKVFLLVLIFTVPSKSCQSYILVDLSPVVQSLSLWSGALHLDLSSTSIPHHRDPILKWTSSLWASSQQGRMQSLLESTASLLTTTSS